MEKHTKYIQELLYFLSGEREKIEDSGQRKVDQDLRKTHNFICDEIKSLHSMLFRMEYQQLRERLAEVFDCSSEVTKRDK